MRRGLVLVLVTLVGGVVRADEQPKPSVPPVAPAPAPAAKPAKPPTPEQAADAALAAVKAKDGAALKVLAAKDDPDPWLVADELVRRGEFDVADAFAKAAPRKAVERMPVYLASRRGRPDDVSRRRRLGDANAALLAGRPAESLESNGPAESAPPEDVTGVRLAFGRGLALKAMGRLEEGATSYLVAADASDRIGWLARASRALLQAGLCAYSRADYPAALSAWERRPGMDEDLGDREGAAGALVNIGVAYFALGNYPKALEAYERGYERAQAIGKRQWSANALLNIGSVHAALGNYPKALEYDERALKALDELGDRAGVAGAMGNEGNVYCELGCYPKALEYLERALTLSEGAGDRAGFVMTLGSLGSVYQSLGDFPRALATFERALKLEEEAKNRPGVARALGNIGLAEQALGDAPKALEHLERALEMKESIGDRPGAARSLGNLGHAHSVLGNYPKALEYYERALKLAGDLGDRSSVAWTLGAIGIAAREMGDPKTALKFLDRAVREADRIRADSLLVVALRELARTQLAAGEPLRALQNAKQGVHLLERMLGGLAEEQGAEARARYAGLFGVGTLAASRSEDVAEVSYFLESGRAGSLMESLGGRQALRWQALPEELRRAESEARAGESLALALYSKALDAGELAETRSMLAALDVARTRVNDVVERIQREAKKAASVSYPRAATLEEMEGWLGEGEALVLYGLCLDEALAVVLTREDARIVRIGKASDVKSACEALDLTDRDADPQAPIAALAKMLVAPLALKDDVTRVLLSPEGPLSYVPMALLFPGREVIYEPSGTTYGLLREDAAKKGTGVLALGDPDYGVKFDPHALEMYAVAQRGGGRLVPLPGTRDEAVAIGNVTLLGKDASEAGLRAEIVKKKARWHGIHFACHGLVNPDRPTLSSLALTPDAENDGFLTALEVLRMEIPSDLVVLSACETGKGKIVGGEGIVGLTRAFMYAGSPRVICSLWKVDDDATRALMTRFYELWNPKDRKPGLPTAEALKQAQEYVKSQEKWKHPYFWAAWVLWGLPE